MKAVTDEFFHRSMDLNCRATLDGMFADLNHRWLEVLGYEIEDLKSRPFMEFIHPDDVASTEEALNRLAGADSVVDFRNRYRTKSGSFRWLQWSAYPPGEGDQHIYASARVIDSLVTFERQLERTNKVLESITLLQHAYIQSGEDREWWDNVLKQVLDTTQSEYGFIGTTGVDERGKYLRTKAITNIAWNDETKRFYDDNAPQGMVFRNMDTLFGRAIRDEKLLIANDVASDPRAGGRPPGHPPLNCFAGIPIADESGMYGLVGIANAPGGFSTADVDLLQPILVLLSNVLRNRALEDRANAAAKQLDAVRQMQGRVLESSQTGFMVIDDAGRLVLVNPQAATLLLPDEDEAERHHEMGLEDRLRDLFAETKQSRMLRDFVKNADATQSEVIELQARRPSAAVRAQVEVVAQWMGEDAGSFPLLLSLNDLQQRQALADSLLLNAKLEERVQQLAENQRHNETLSECVEFLQTCTSLTEGLEVLSRFSSRFYPQAASTQIFGVCEGDSSLMQEFSGSAVDPTSERRVQDCWALRSRRVYSAWDGGHSLRCAHSMEDPGSEYCVPLFSLERVVAVLTVRFVGDVAEATEGARRARFSEFVAMGQSISGALSTIALRESLQRMALTDELTTLPNRRAFQTEASRVMARCRRTNTSFAVAILDIDHFKSINDSFGHAQGDVVLRQVSDLLKRCFRAGDLCARLGGEEFGVLLPGCNSERAQERLSDLLDRVRAGCRVGGRAVTLSAGFVCDSGTANSRSLDELLHRADKALYAAKEGGRDQVREGQ